MFRPGLRHWLFALPLLATLPAVSPQTAPSKSPRQAEESVFIYDVFQGRPACPEAVARLKKLPLRRTLILSIEQGPQYILDWPGGNELLACVLSNLPPPAQTVKALFLQDISFMYNRKEAVRRAALLRRFVHDYPGKLAAAQMDVEPYATEDWSCGGIPDRRALARSLGALLRQVRAQLDGFPLGLDAGWWYATVGRQIPEIAPGTLFRAVDELYLMYYGDPGGPLLGGSAERVLEQLDAPLFFPGPGRVYVALASYEYRSPQHLQAEINKIHARLAARPNFGGFAIFHAGAPFNAPLVRMISGTVTGPDGRGLPDVVIEAGRVRGSSNRCGQFGLRDLPGPGATVVLRRAPYQTEQRVVESLEPGVPHDLGTIRLKRTP
jgi:hypothetical protein